MHELSEESVKALLATAEAAIDEGSVEPLLELVKTAFEEKFEELSQAVRQEPKVHALSLTAILIDHYGEELAKEKLTFIAKSG